MKIEIKQALLEGHAPEVITEAVHANHPHLNKKLLKNPNTSYLEGKQIEQNRKSLVDDIRHSRRQRDDLRKSVVDVGSVDQKRERNQGSNFFDNNARARSQTGGKFASDTEENKGFANQKLGKIIHSLPRVISSANK